jgi:hypothetical protein
MLLHQLLPMTYVFSLNCILLMYGAHACMASCMARAHAARPIIKVWLVTVDHSPRVPKDFVCGQTNIVEGTDPGQDQASRTSELTDAYEVCLGKRADHGHSDSHAVWVCAMCVTVHCAPALRLELEPDLIGVDIGHELGVHFQEGSFHLANQDVNPPAPFVFVEDSVVQQVCVSLLCIRDVNVPGKSTASPPEVYQLIPVFDVH